MPNRSSKTKRPRDPNQLAKLIVDMATGEAKEAAPDPPQIEPTSEAIRKAAAELGRRGGLKGGRVRATNLTPERRAEIAKKAARKRWGKDLD